MVIGDQERKRITKTHHLAIGRRNICRLIQVGKLELVERKINRYNIVVTGLAETHWKGSGHFKTVTENMIHLKKSGCYSCLQNVEKNSYGFLAHQ